MNIERSGHTSYLKSNKLLDKSTCVLTWQRLCTVHNLHGHLIHSLIAPHNVLIGTYTSVLYKVGVCLSEESKVVLSAKDASVVLGRWRAT